MNRRKMLNIFLMVLLFVAVAFGSYATYTYLTQQEQIKQEIQLGKATATITVTGAKGVYTNGNNDLAYIDYKNDFILNKHKLLGKMASEIKITITATNTFPTRVKIKLPRLTETNMNGLLFVIIPETKENHALPIDLQILNSKLQYGYIAAGQTAPASWTDLVDMTGFTDQTTTDVFREKIDTYNYNLLKTYYENDANVVNKDTPVELSYRILLWGDYLNLTDKTDYLKKTFNFNVIIKVIQDIKHYGGTLDYEND